MKIVDKVVKKPVVSILASKIENGTIFRGSIGNGAFEGPFLKVFQSVIQLHSEWHTWYAADVLEIYNYQPVEAELHIMRDL